MLLYFYFAHYVFGNLGLFALNIAFFVSNILSFVSQLCLCWIFWQLSTKYTQKPRENEQVEARTSEPQIEIEDYDEQSEVQARIWNQFIRKKIVNEYILKRVNKDDNFTGGMLVSSRQVSSASTYSRRSLNASTDIYARYQMPEFASTIQHDDDLPDGPSS